MICPKVTLENGEEVQYVLKPLQSQPSWVAKLPPDMGIPTHAQSFYCAEPDTTASSSPSPADTEGRFTMSLPWVESQVKSSHWLVCPSQVKSSQVKSQNIVKSSQVNFQVKSSQDAIAAAPQRLETSTSDWARYKACADNHQNCAYWAGSWQCTLEPHFMLVHCRLSCGVCGEYVCEDKMAMCGYWASRGECTRNGFYMRGYCQKSCSVCLDKECIRKPCLNGGLCTDVEDSYTCTCPDGFAGDNCEINVDECSTAHCMNGGTCVDGVNNYTCNCTGEYEGFNCEHRVDECNAAPCLNGGTCTLTDTHFTCTCATGFVGETCEIELDVSRLVTSVASEAGSAETTTETET